MRKCLTALIVSTSLIALPAYAQSRKELAAVDVQLQQRLTTLEQRMLTGDPAAERLMQRMDSLEAAQRSLTGEIERLVYERDTLQADVQAMSAELQARQALIDRMRIHLDAVDLVASEQRSVTAPRVYGETHSGEYVTQPYSDGAAILSQVPAAPIFREENIDVQTYSGGGNDVAELGTIGQTKLAEGDFIGAQTAFKQYLDYNPDAADSGEMSFWLGESYFVRGGYADAADAYIASMRKDPNGVKAPDAMVRLAATLRELGNQSEACQTLAAFGSQFPSAPEAAKEKARIEAARTGC